MWKIEKGTWTADVFPVTKMKEKKPKKFFISQTF